MAKALVKSFMQRLNSLILQENESSPALQDQIQTLKNRLEEIGSFRGEAGRSKQEDGLVCSWESHLIETVHHAENCIDQYVAKTRSQDGSDLALSIVQFCSELDEIDARLAGISSRRSQINMPLTSEGKEENGRSSSIYDDVDVGEESLTPFALNYRNLPSYLRSCLLYFTFLTKRISRGRLVRLLVAEGMFQERPGEVMEDIAEQNINDLVGQGILQVEISYFIEMKLKVVDPYRRICKSKLQQGKRITRYVGSDSNFRQSFGIGLIYYSGETITTSLNDLPIESLFVIPVKGVYSQGLLSDKYWDEGIPDDHLASVRSALYPLKFLRVLDLEGLKIKSLPEEIGDLIHLRYLDLKHSALDEIPESIGNLQNLQTLDIRLPRGLKELPSGILNLLNLRHLMMPQKEIKVPSGIGRLTNLQSLTGLFARPGILKELSSLTQLRELKLYGVSIEHGNEVFASVMKMRGLLSLSLETRFGEDKMLPTLDPFLPPPFIRKLCLCGRLIDLPDWVCSMESLTKLTLAYSFLPEEAISHILI